MERILYTNFEQVGDTMDSILGSHVLANKLTKYNLSKIWGQIVGKRFETRSYPATLNNKVLKVACENAQITSELVMSKRLIMQKLQPMAQTLGLEIEDVMFSHKIWQVNS